MDKAKQYTFEDWASGKLYFEKGRKGEFVKNDSEKYLYLVVQEKMTLDTLNKIQEAQLETYEFGIKQTLENDEAHLTTKTRFALDYKKSIEIRIEEMEKYLQENRVIYEDLVTGKFHRSMKYGAKFITHNDYASYKSGKGVDFIMEYNIACINPEEIHENIREATVKENYERASQLIYPVIEVSILWLQRLKEKLHNIEFIENEISTSTITPIATTWTRLIKGEMQETRLPEIESKIKEKIERWKQGEDRIECAAFCQLLFDNKYFEKGCSIRKSVNQFALSKYGTDISLQLESSKKEDRERHKNLLKKYLK